MTGARILLLVLLGWGYAPALAQDDSQQRQLEQIRGELAQLRADLVRSQASLQTNLASLENIEQQTTLQQQALRILQGQVQKSQAEIQSLDSRINTLTGQIGQLREMFSRQIVFSYKYRKSKTLEWILGAQSFNQALLRYRYFQKISESANQVYRRLADKQAELQRLQNRRRGELQQQQQLAAEKDAEQRDLAARREERQQLVAQITRNTSLLEKAVREKMNSFEELKGLIGSLETQRSVSPPVEIDWSKISGNFASQQKKLNWPIRGEIVHPFGKYRNPRLKTVLVNNGIDIKAKKGAEVRSVFSGVVSLITYMSGFGNTVIIDHNNSYYTVYAHLDEVLVKKFQIVEAGTVIGTVGDSGSLEGALLHFEIYGGNKPLNPGQWLKK